jgi:hypothetical protein
VQNSATERTRASPGKFLYSVDSISYASHANLGGNILNMLRSQAVYYQILIRVHDRLWKGKPIFIDRQFVSHDMGCTINFSFYSIHFPPYSPSKREEHAHYLLPVLG